LALAEAVLAASGGPRRKGGRGAVEASRNEVALARQGSVDARRAFQAASAPASNSTDKEKLELAVKALGAMDALTAAGEKMAEVERSEMKKEAETDVVNGILMAMLGQMMKPDVEGFVARLNKNRGVGVEKVDVGHPSILAHLPPFLRNNKALRKGWALDLALTPGGKDTGKGSSTSDKLFYLVSPFPFDSLLGSRFFPPTPPYPHPHHLQLLLHPPYYHRTAVRPHFRVH